MRRSELIGKVEHLPFFTRADLRAFGLPDKTTEVYLSRAVDSGRLFRLKRGLFTTRAFYEQVKGNNQLDNYRELLANIMVTPSYISAEYVLSKYELLSEAVYTITSLTSGRPVAIENAFGNFRYRNISNEHLARFETVHSGPFQIKIASMTQALFDYLYLKKKEIRKVTADTVRELRINFHLLSAEQIRELRVRAKESGSIKLQKIITYLEELHAD